MSTKVFTYTSFANAHEKNPRYKQTIEKYEKEFNIDRNTDVKEHLFYQDYLSQFNADIEFVTPPYIDMDKQDWELLARLIFGSFASSYALTLDEDWKKNPTEKVQVHVQIGVSKDKVQVLRSFYELHPLQIQKIFHIYLNEQIELLIISEDSRQEYNAALERNEGTEEDEEDFDFSQIEFQKALCLQLFEQQVDNLMTEANLYRQLGQIISNKESPNE